MNKRQKQVQQSLLKDEAAVLKELEKSYQKAIDDINAFLARLYARKDTENLQAIIYQIKYQKAIKSELEAFLSVLHTNNYKLIDDYLQRCYENAHIGMLFDIQGQGIPLIFPLEQEQMIAAITLNSKLSAPLYNSLGYNLDFLKISVASELSRGIAQSLSYAEIARNLENTTKVDFNKTANIVQTEGHRIQQESTYNAQKRAKAKGADIVKQWDSTLDGKTRPTHRELDGQIVEVDEYFHSSGGGKALYPGGFSDPKEDCRCRCCLIQRAKWALSDEEFTKMNGKTNELQHFESVEDYEKFKKIFWQVTSNA